MVNQNTTILGEGKIVVSMAITAKYYFIFDLINISSSTFNLFDIGILISLPFIFTYFDINRYGCNAYYIF